ncbi:Sub10p [Orbilia blumenaviensis]|uniref:Sub10p n=1 Tax=Orbilia blumenaviensis TaxID=1796055 RepID=A0AAV9VNX8_9PEZI
MCLPSTPTVRRVLSILFICILWFQIGLSAGEARRLVYKIGTAEKHLGRWKFVIAPAYRGNARELEAFVRDIERIAVAPKKDSVYKIQSKYLGFIAVSPVVSYWYVSNPVTRPGYFGNVVAENADIGYRPWPPGTARPGPDPELELEPQSPASDNLGDNPQPTNQPLVNKLLRRNAGTWPRRHSLIGHGAPHRKIKHHGIQNSNYDNHTDLYGIQSDMIYHNRSALKARSDDEEEEDVPEMFYNSEPDTDSMGHPDDEEEEDVPGMVYNSETDTDSMGHTDDDLDEWSPDLTFLEYDPENNKTVLPLILLSQARDLSLEEIKRQRGFYKPTHGGRGVTIYSVGSGCSLEHEEFKGRYRSEWIFAGPLPHDERRDYHEANKNYPDGMFSHPSQGYSGTAHASNIVGLGCGQAPEANLVLVNNRPGRNTMSPENDVEVLLKIFDHRRERIENGRGGRGAGKVDRLQFPGDVARLTKGTPAAIPNFCVVGDVNTETGQSRWFKKSWVDLYAPSSNVLGADGLMPEEGWGPAVVHPYFSTSGTATATALAAGMIAYYLSLGDPIDSNDNTIDLVRFRSWSRFGENSPPMIWNGIRKEEWVRTGRNREARKMRHKLPVDEFEGEPFLGYEPVEYTSDMEA